MRLRTLITILMLTAMCSVVGAASALAGPATPMGGQPQNLVGPHEVIPGLDKAGQLQTALSVAGAVDFDLAQSFGADYLQGMQADITEDNAGNGDPDSPDDPDDGGWDWVTTAFSHSTSASPTNIYGATAMGLYYTYLEAGGIGYLLAMTDAADTMANNPNVRSGADLVYLMLYNDLPAVAGTAYEDSARAKYDARITTYGSATLFAEYIRDVRGASYPNGIIPWDIGIWVRVAAMLDARFPGNGYDTDADDMAEVIYQDSFMDNPGFFDIVDDAGWDPTYADVNFWWYNLGITGLIDAFDAAGVHTGEISGLVTLLLDGQAAHGGISFSYGANAGDEDWQSTAYTMMTLGRLDQATYQSQLNEMGYFLAATQDVSGGWVYSSGNHYPEIGGECAAGLYFTTNTTVYDLADAIVDDDFTWQGDVDLYNDANGTNYIWGYDAFATIQEAIDAVDGSTVEVAAGTYNETISFGTGFSMDNLTVTGADPGDRPFVTGGVNFQNSGAFNGLTLQDLYLTGDAGGNRIINMGNTGAVNDLTVNNCVLDGEDVAGRSSFYGANLGGFVTITGCEIMDVRHWSAMDLDGSGGTVLPKTTITFTGNNIHDCGGAVSLRGHDTDRTDLVIVANNVWTNINEPGESAWACVEITHADILNVFDNVFDDVIENSWGEGQGIQAWDLGTIDIYDNMFTDCFWGIWLPSVGGGAPPAGSIHHNSFIGTTGTLISTDHSSGSFTSDLNAEANYWGTIDYATISGKMLGMVDFDPWCSDDTHAYCTLTYPVSEVWVDDDWAGSSEGDIVGGHLFGYDAFATVQDGIDGVSGSTVNVAAGTYIEQLHITTDDLTLVGSGVDVTIIQSPATLTAFFVTTTNSNYPIVFVDGATNVSISGLTIDGNGLGNANYRFVGLAFWNSGGSFTDAKVVNIMDTPFSGAQHGVGVYSYNDTGGPYTIVMNDVVVDDFQKNAVALLGLGLTVDLDDVTTTGAGPTTVTAQNGLQVGPGVLGTVDNCTISAIAYTGGTWTATGFLNDGDVIATGLVIDACQTSVYWTDGSGTFTGGTITNPLGDAFYAYNSTTTKGASPKLLPAPLDPDLSQHTTKAVQNVTLSNTTITGTGAVDSWGIGAFSTSADVVNLTVTGCTIDNWDYGIYAYDYGGPVNIVASGNAIVNCPHGMGASPTLTQQNAIGNWWGSSDAATVAGLVDGPVDYSPWWGANYVGDPHTSAWTWFVNNTGTIQAAIDAASAGDVIYISAGAYAEGPQITVDKDLTIIGETAKSLVTITPTGNTGSSGDSRGWFLVPDGVVFNLSNVTLDGAGFYIYQGIRHKGNGTLDNIAYLNIVYPGYGGVAVAAFGGTFITISNSSFDNIGRVGALLWTDGLYTGNTYTGKGDGDWLDYGIDMTSSTVDIIDNTFTGCTGVASSDGSTSGGVLATTYYATGTTANCEGNTFTANSTGIMIGYDASDASTVTVTTGNVLLGNEYGVTTTASATTSLTCYGNTFNNTYNAEDNAGGTWDDGVSVGNCWMDFESNSGYPTNYVVGGTAGAIDNYPNVDCGLNLSPDDVLYHCDGSFTFDVSIGDAIVDLEAGRYYFEYPAELVFEGATALDPNFTVMTNLTDNATGVDVLIVDFMVGTGSQDGPADLYTIELSGSTSYCSGEDIAMTADSMYDGDNELIVCPVPSPITLIADCDDPVFTVNSPADGGFYNTAPVLDLGATDNCDIDAVYYQIDGCTELGWTAITGPGYSGNSWSDAAWAVPGFAGMTEEEHCVRFKVIDDNELGNSDSCTYTWCFSKDVSNPSPPSDFVAEPGHNKVKLAWTSSTSTDVVGYRIQRVAWGDYPLYAPPGPTYPVDENADVNVFDGTGNDHVDTYLLDNTTRDVYYFAIFAYDAAGNFSMNHTGASARSTSYWLGDIADEMLTMGAYDGYVLTGDLYHLGASYWYSTGDPDFEPEADWGPTADSDPKGIPTPDGTIGIYDLAIFAINYGAVNPTMKTVPLFASQKVDGPLDLTMSSEVVEGQVVHRLFLNNSDGQAKTLHVVIDCADATLVSCQTQVEAEVSGYPVFAKARQLDDQVEYDFALIGNGATISGSGELATFVFSPSGSTPPEAILVEAIVLDNSNQEVPVALINGAKNSAALPVTYALSQNYPNPFNPTTQIAYQVPNPGHVTIEVFNLVGQKVQTLVDDYCGAGNHVAIWHGTDGAGRSVSSGVYFYRMTADGFVMSRKMMLVK